MWSLHRGFVLELAQWFPKYLITSIVEKRKRIIIQPWNGLLPVVKLNKCALSREFSFLFRYKYIYMLRNVCKGNARTAWQPLTTGDSSSRRKRKEWQKSWWFSRKRQGTDVYAGDVARNTFGRHSLLQSNVYPLQLHEFIL